VVGLKGGREEEGMKDGREEEGMKDGREEEGRKGGMVGVGICGGVLRRRCDIHIRRKHFTVCGGNWQA